MNGDLLRIVEGIHREKNIPKEIVFEAIEAAILSAAKKHYEETDEVEISIDQESGNISGVRNNEPIDTEELGRIAAQTAKQVMIQKIREAERDAIYGEYDELKGQLVTGAVQRFDGRAATVNLGKTEGILPRSEQIPGESHRPGERVRATVLDVRKVGSRVKIILSRTHPDFVRRLFEIEVPEVAEHVIDVKAVAREAGYRTKVAVSSIDQKVDCVGACVGVRGTRIKNIVEELAGERIDIVRWNESLQVLIPNALQPAEIEEVILCPMLGRAIVLVREDQLSLAIGRRGQNVRLASKLCGWDIEIMTRDELDEQIDRVVEAFAEIPGMAEELGERLVTEGFLSYDDLSVIEPNDLVEMGGITPEQAGEIIAYAEQQAERQEEEARKEKERQRLLAAEQAAAEAEAAAAAEEGEASAEAEAGEGEAAAEAEAAPAGEGEAASPAEGETAEESGDLGQKQAAESPSEEDAAAPATATDEQLAQAPGAEPSDEDVSQKSDRPAAGLEADVASEQPATADQPAEEDDAEEPAAVAQSPSPEERNSGDRHTVPPETGEAAETTHRERQPE